MRSDRFEYFLNAVHYCMWRTDISVSEILIYKPISWVISIVLKLFPKETEEKYTRRFTENRKKTNHLFYDNKTGLHIRSADYSFVAVWCFYLNIFACILWTISYKILGDLNILAAIFCIMISFIVGYIPAYRAVFSKDKYLRYFKRFEKNGKNWHRKWFWITVLFCIGGILALILGFGIVVYAYLYP